MPILWVSLDGDVEIYRSREAAEGYVEVYDLDDGDFIVDFEGRLFRAEPTGWHVRLTPLGTTDVERLRSMLLALLQGEDVDGNTSLQELSEALIRKFGFSA